MDGLKITTGPNINSELTTGRSTSTQGQNQDLRINSGTSGVGSIGSASGETSFAQTLKNAVNSVDQLQKESDLKMQQLATGQSNNIHETMIAAEKADIALRLMVQVRNKIIEAYQEVMRMQV